MTIEDLVRAAQERQAEQAVPIERVRAALPARIARSRRRRRLGGIGAAVLAVAVAVSVPVAVLRERGPDRPPPVALALMGDLPMSFRIGWLPAGYHEQVRGADVEGAIASLGPTLQRVWRQGDRWGGPEIQLLVRTQVPGAERSLNHAAGTVDVNGLVGWYRSEGGRAAVAWAVDDHTQVEVVATNQDLPQKDLLRVARSVVRDPGSFTSPVRLRWLPDGWDTTHVAVSGASPASWRALIMGGPPRPPLPRISAYLTPEEEDRLRREWRAIPSAGLSVTVDSTTNAPEGGTRLTVGGRPARNPVRAGQSSIFLVVDLGAGRLMTVTGDAPGLTLDDLRTTAEMVEIAPAPQEWIGL